MFKLKKLDLRYNGLDEFHIENFESLEYVDLSDFDENLISNDLENLTLKNLPKLKHLDLEGNNLDKLDVSTVPTIKYLFLTGNLIELENLKVHKQSRIKIYL